MKMLSGLLRLRQVCCDLRLLGLQPNEHVHRPSSICSMSYWRRSIDGGHRVLVFSQFVKMLDLIRERFEAKEPRFAISLAKRIIGSKRLTGFRATKAFRFSS